MDKITLLPEEYKRILRIKRDLHMHPELSKAEYRTSGVIRTFLEKLPCVELLKTGTPTGVLARISGDGSGTEIALRADIDALAQTESYESPWKSHTEGVMHACGHDFHTASLLGAALILSRMKAEGRLANTVDLIFQPAEEGTTGARSLINAGLFERIHPLAIFGFHNWPTVDSGKIVLHEGALMAAKRNMTIRIKGRGGHGSMPHLNVDPIVCAAAVVQSLQTIVSRNTDPMDSLVLSISRIEGGSHVNRVADQVEMKATIRSLSDEALDRGISRTEAIVSNTAAAYECEWEIKWEERIPAVRNLPAMAEVAKMAAEAAAPGCITDATPTLASEDFALYSQLVPSWFFWVGSRMEGEPVEELHRPGFHTDDRAMVQAAQLYAAAAMLDLENLPPQ